MRAAHLAGDLKDLKSPKSFITERALIDVPLRVKGAINQQV